MLGLMGSARGVDTKRAGIVADLYVKGFATKGFAFIFSNKQTTRRKEKEERLINSSYLKR